MAFYEAFSAMSTYNKVCLEEWYARDEMQVLRPPASAALVIACMSVDGGINRVTMSSHCRAGGSEFERTICKKKPRTFAFQVEGDNTIKTNEDHGFRAGYVGAIKRPEQSTFTKVITEVTGDRAFKLDGRPIGMEQGKVSSARNDVALHVADLMRLRLRSVK